VTSDAPLEQRLKRLMLLRLVIVTTLLLIAVYVEAVSETLRPVNPLYYLIVGTYALTVVHAVALRFVRQVVLLAYAQVVGDLVTITGLLYLTGGIRAGFILLYPMSVLSGAVLLYRRGGLVFAVLATSLYAATLWLVRAGAIPPEGLYDVPFLTPKALLYSVFVTGVACGTVGVIGSWLAESLRSVGEQLEEAAEQMADLQELNQAVVTSIHSGLMTVDRTGRVLWINDFGAAILGRRPAELTGRHLAVIVDSHLFDVTTLDARAADERLARVEVPCVRADSTTVDLGLTVSPLSGLTGGRGGHLIVFQDLTDIKRLEREVRMNEKLAAVGEMTAQLAHEIRNPLGSISGSAQVLIEEKGLPPEHERLLAIIVRESRRLSDTLNQFLYQTRASVRPAQPVDIGRVVEESVTLLRNGPEVSDLHAVEFQRDAGPHVCLADPDQIAQVFWNLARNGLEAMPNGGTLSVQLSREGPDLVLSVRDQGRGITREDQKRMFQPFRSGTPGGTGLGLAIVYGIVHEHRGTITVRSAPARGTEVHVRLPALSVAVTA
jgi:two-component system, NtrC family, sensor histidine kinase PilS